MLAEINGKRLSQIKSWDMGASPLNKQIIGKAAEEEEGGKGRREQKSSVKQKKFQSGSNTYLLHSENPPSS